MKVFFSQNSSQILGNIHTGISFFRISDSEQDQESQVAPQVEKYHHTILKYPLREAVIKKKSLEFSKWGWGGDPISKFFFYCLIHPEIQ